MSRERVFVTPDQRPVRHAAWGAVFAGALVALMVTLLLNLLLAGIGFVSFDPASSSDPLAGFGTTSVIALIVINVVALFVGGFVTARMVGSSRRGTAAVHGLLTWSVLTIGTILLLSTALGRIVGGAAGLVGNTFSSVTQGISSVAPEAAQTAQNQGVTLDNVQDRVNQFLTDAGVNNPEQAGQRLVDLVTQRLQNGESLTSTDAQEQYKEFLANNSDLTEAEIDQQVQQFTQQAEQTVQQAEQTAEEASGIAGQTAFYLFGVLAVGAVVAMLGAVSGSPKDARA